RLRQRHGVCHGGHLSRSRHNARAGAYLRISRCQARARRKPVSNLRIYGIARTRAFRPIWMAMELDLDFEHLPIEIGDAGARTPEFLKLNPNGRLPVIIDDGFLLSESLAITLYLARKHSYGRLYPDTLHEE